MNNPNLPIWLALMVLVAAGYGAWKWWQVEQFRESQAVGGLVIEDGPPLEQFELTERSGKPFRSKDMKGKVWVTTFFFSTCAGSCPRLNASVKYMNSLEELKDVTWVSISVDPTNDTLPRLNEYADSYSADPNRWLFCRGDFNYVRRVGEDFMKVPVMHKDHNDKGIVIDKHGKIRYWHDNMTRLSDLERLKKILLECLEEEGPPVEEQPLVETTEEATAETPQEEPAAA